MPSVLKVITKNAKGIVKSLRNYARKGIKKSSKQSMTTSLKLIVACLKSEANFGEYSIGAIKKAIGYKIVSRKGGMFIQGISGVRKNVKSVSKMRRGKTTPFPRYYLHLVVKGVKPHSLGISKGKVTNERMRNRIHPGHKGNNFVEKAFQKVKSYGLANKFKNRLTAEWGREKSNAA